MKKMFLGFILLLFSFAAWAAVDINAASKEELQTLSGIGPEKAQAIIDYRAQHGPFKSTQDLTKVKGIGQKTVDKLAPDIAVSSAPSAAKKDARKDAPKDMAKDSKPDTAKAKDDKKK